MSIVEKVGLTEEDVLNKFVELIDKRDYKMAYDYYTNVIDDCMRNYLDSHSDAGWRVKVIKRRRGGRF